MPNALMAGLLLAWNLLLLSVWVGKYQVHPGDIAAGIADNFPATENWPETFAANWWSFISASIACAGILSLAGFAGQMIGRWLGVRGQERPGAPAEIGMGLGAVGSGVFGIGLTGLLFAPPSWVSLVLLGAFGIAGIRRYRQNAYDAIGAVTAEFATIPVVFRVLIACLVSISVLGIFNIEMGFDALAYHLRLPTFYLYRHKVYDVWHNYYATFPAHIEMLYMLGQLAHGDMVARLVNVCFGALLLAVTARIAGELDAPVGWTVVLLGCSPLFLLLLTRCYVDLGMAFYASTALMLMLRWRRSGGVPVLIAAGALGGFAMGSKLFAVVVWVSLVMAASRGFSTAIGRRSLLFCNIAACIVFFPWLMRSYFLRGNPVHPFLDAFMGLPAVRPGEHALPFEETGAMVTAVPKASVAAVRAFFLEGGHIEGPLSPAIGGALPFILLGVAGGGPRFAGRMAAVCLVLWLALFAEIRFILPALPPMIALAMRSMRQWSADSRLQAGLVRMVIFLGVTLGALQAAAVQWRDFKPFSVPLGLETGYAKVQRIFPPVPFRGYARDHVNANVPGNERILILCSQITYYVDRECISDIPFGTSHLTTMMREGGTANGMARWLRQRGIGWILSAETGVNQFMNIPGFFDVPPDGWAEWKRLLAEQTEIVWQTDYFTLMCLTRPHRAGRLPMLPVYEVIAFRGANEALADGRYDEAVVSFANPPALLADIGSTWAGLGFALGGDGKWTGAMKAYERAMALGIRTPQVLSGLACAYLNLGRLGEAMKLAEEAKRADPASALADQVLVRVRAATGPASGAGYRRGKGTGAGTRSP